MDWIERAADELSATPWEFDKRIRAAHEVGCEYKAALAAARAACGEAKALADKLVEIDSSPEYLGVWTLAHAHGYVYKGLTYEVELRALQASLRAIAAGKEEDDETHHG